MADKFDLSQVMPKSKYRFNPETLSYDKIKLSFKNKLLKFLTRFATSIVVAVILIVVLSIFFDFPKERVLKRENVQLLLQYEIMNKQIDRITKLLQDVQMHDDNIYRMIFEVEPIPSSIRKAGFGGINRYAKLQSLENAELVIETAKKLNIIETQLYIQSKSYDEVINLAKNKEKMLQSIPAIMPLSNKDLKRTASGWGYRIHPIYKIRKFHYGMDFSAPTGTEIYATGNGTILLTKHSRRGYGNRIVIAHGYGYKTLYAHLSKILVKKGEKVKRGDVIGLVGSSGLSVAPHVHYEVHKNNKKINPVNYYFNDLTPQEYEKMIEISLKSGQSFD